MAANCNSDVEPSPQKRVFDRLAEIHRKNDDSFEKMAKFRDIMRGQVAGRSSNDSVYKRLTPIVNSVTEKLHVLNRLRSEIRLEMATFESNINHSRPYDIGITMEISKRQASINRILKVYEEDDDVQFFVKSFLPSK